MKNPFVLKLLSLPLAAMLLTACAGAKKSAKEKGAAGDMNAETVAAPVLEVTESTDTMTVEGAIRGPEFAADPNLKTVTFGYDRYELSDEVRAALQANAALIKSRKEWAVLVEGHCDERGTTEYNLALGQKRAKAVRDYYVRLGVPESAVGTISYGEEMPVCEESTEACWNRNRRAETKVRAQ